MCLTLVTVRTLSFEHYTMDLVMEIAELIGVNLRDPQVEQYATKEQLERKTEQSF